MGVIDCALACSVVAVVRRSVCGRMRGRMRACLRNNVHARRFMGSRTLMMVMYHRTCNMVYSCEKHIFSVLYGLQHIPCNAFFFKL